ANVAMITTGTTALLAVTPGPPSASQFRDVGLGGRLLASWAPNPEPDLAGYRLIWGRESSTYVETLDVGHACCYELAGLEDGVTYYAAVLAYDSMATLARRARNLLLLLGSSPLRQLVLQHCLSRVAWD
ncbi:MAG: fibronectin type III domain-containing protein, partial [candidate division WOR-3 bacterium]